MLKDAPIVPSLRLGLWMLANSAMHLKEFQQRNESRLSLTTQGSPGQVGGVESSAHRQWLNLTCFSSFPYLRLALHIQLSSHGVIPNSQPKCYNRVISALLFLYLTFERILVLGWLIPLGSLGFVQEVISHIVGYFMYSESIALSN